MGRRHREETRHHLIPQSRFPKGTTQEEKDDDNIVMLDDDFHKSLHFISGNLTPGELYHFLGIVLRPGQVWTHDDLRNLRQRIKRER